MKKPFNMARLGSVVLFCAIAIGLSACDDQDQKLIVDGPRNAYFESDLAACKDVSLQRAVDNSNIAAGAIVGGLAGAVGADKKSDRAEGGLAGAAIGGLMGAGEAQLEADKAREQIVINCMRGRGHRVVN